MYQMHLLYAIFTKSDADRVKIDNLVIYEEGWEASSIIGIIVLISLTVTCFIRVAFDRAFWRDKAKSRFVDFSNHFWNGLFRIQMVFPLLVRPAIRKEKELESDLENDQIDKYFTKIFSIFIFRICQKCLQMRQGRVFWSLFSCKLSIL